MLFWYSYLSHARIVAASHQVPQCTLLAGKAAWHSPPANGVQADLCEGAQRKAG